MATYLKCFSRSRMLATKKQNIPAPAPASGPPERWSTETRPPQGSKGTPATRSAGGQHSGPESPRKPHPTRSAPAPAEADCAPVENTEKAHRLRPARPDAPASPAPLQAKGRPDQYRDLLNPAQNTGWNTGADAKVFPTPASSQADQRQHTHASGCQRAAVSTATVSISNTSPFPASLAQHRISRAHVLFHKA
jgi:hypothetical protein